MPIIPFNNNMDDIKAFGHDVTKVMAFGHQVWQTSIPDYLCFTALETGTFTLTIPAAVTSTYLSYVEWSKDGRTWNHRDNTSEAVTIDVQVAQGEKVYWRGSGNATAMGTTVGTQNSQFSSTGNFDVSGNIMSLLFTNNFEEQTSLPNVRYSFTALFRNCSKLISAENLLLPATKLQMECYRNLFLSCSNLVKGIKVLPAMQLMQNCYLQMYGNCSSLTEGTEIHATTAVSQCCYGMYTGCSSLTIPKPILFTNTASYCCYQMYRFCTSLEVAPDLTQATLADNCCRQMFKGCTKLKYIKCLATNISATQCLLDWCDGVSSTGTFIQASGVTWPRGASGIPTGWVDVEKRTMPQGYKQLLWVSTNSKAYVNTGIAGDNDNLKITTVFNMSAYVDWGAIYGNYVGDSYNVTRLVQGSSDACSCCNLNVKSNNSGNQFDYDVFHINIPHMVIQSKNSVIYNGTTKNISGKASGTANSGYIALGNRSMTNPNTTRNIGLCIYTYKIEDTSLSSVLCDYVACIRESDSKAGFYDFVSNAFIPSATSSDFTAGEEI